MRILMDGVDWQPQTGEPQEDRGALLEDLKAQALAQGRVLVSLVVDGSELDEEGFRNLQGGRELRCETQSVRELVRDSLSQTKEYFPALQRGVEGIADRLEEGKVQEALQLLQQATEGIGWVLHVVQNCRLLLGIAEEEPRTGNLQADCARLQEILESLSGSLEQERFFELAFHLREELLPLLSQLNLYTEEFLVAAEEPVQ